VDVSRFLTREPGALQRGLVERREARGRHGARRPLEPAIGRSSRRERDLLLEDDLDEGLEAWLPVPERWRPETLHHRREVRIAPAELGDALGERLDGERCGHAHRTREPAPS
jgi:hypothetical protein